MNQVEKEFAMKEEGFNEERKLTDKELVNGASAVRGTKKDILEMLADFYSVNDERIIDVLLYESVDDPLYKEIEEKEELLGIILERRRLIFKQLARYRMIQEEGRREGLQQAKEEMEQAMKKAVMKRKSEQSGNFKEEPM